MRLWSSLKCSLSETLILLFWKWKFLMKTWKIIFCARSPCAPCSSCLRETVAWSQADFSFLRTCSVSGCSLFRSQDSGGDRVGPREGRQGKLTPDKSEHLGAVPQPWQLIQSPFTTQTMHIHWASHCRADTKAANSGLFVTLPPESKAPRSG